MKNKIFSFVITLVAACFLVSCLGDTENEFITYDDTAITAVTFGTLVRTVHAKTAAKKDTVYNATFTGSTYPVSIDHLNRTIFNVDSLPIGTKMNRILLSVTTKNSGIATIKSLTDDTEALISSSDSIDFSKERTVFVYSNSGQYKRSYKVKFVAHQEQEDSFAWKKMAICSEFAAAKSVKAVVLGEKIYALAKTATDSKLYTSSISDGKEWTLCTTLGALTTEATIAASDEKVFILDEESLYTTSDASSFESLDATGLKALAGVCSDELFALSNDNTIKVSLDNGKNWDPDAADSEGEYLPTKDITGISMVTPTNEEISRIMIVGNRDTDIYDEDSTAVVWSKVVEQDHSYDMPWSYQPFIKQNLYKLPNMDDIAVAKYHKGMLAIGGISHGKHPVEAYKMMYYSIDGGLSWHYDERFQMPEKFSGSGAAIATDKNNMLWIIAAGSGEVWRGRLSQLGWK